MVMKTWCQHVSRRHLALTLLLVPFCLYMLSGHAQRPGRQENQILTGRDVIPLQSLRNSSMTGSDVTDIRPKGVRRADRVREICDLLKPKMTQATHTMNPYYFILADEKYKTLYCTVSKCGSTSWKNLLLKIRNNGKAPANMGVHTWEYLAKYNLVFLNEMTSAEVEYRLEHYYKYAIVRHPLDRLVSTYRDKFVGEGEVYFKNVVAKWIKALRQPLKGESPEHSNREVEFPEFVSYVLGHDPLTWERHWLSMYSHCHPCHIKYDFIAQVETLDEDAPHLIAEMKMPFQELLHINTHTNASNVNKFAQYYDDVHVKDYKRILNSYYNDLLMFGYKEPTFAGFS